VTLIDVQSPGVAHGIGLFETMLVVNGRAIFAQEHFDRMARSAMEIGFPIPDETRFHDAVRVAVQEHAGESAVRCVYTAGGSIGDARSWTLAAEAGPIPPVTRSRRAEGRAMTLDASYRRSLPQHKLTSYAVCVIGLQRAIVAGADEALFTDATGNVLEGTATNVFAIAGDTLITAPVAAGILPGITRAWVLAEAARRGIAVEERPPAPAELHDGAFLAGSLTLVTSLRVSNGVACRAPGEVFTEIARAWADLIQP
jgi:branched-chain amino acid aminotransferase